MVMMYLKWLLFPEQQTQTEDIQLQRDKEEQHPHIWEAEPSECVAFLLEKWQQLVDYLKTAADWFSVNWLLEYSTDCLGSALHP